MQGLISFKNLRLLVYMAILCFLLTHSSWQSNTLAQTVLPDPQPTSSPQIETFAAVKEGRAILLYQPQSTAYHVLNIATRRVEALGVSTSQIKSFGTVSRVYPILETGQLLTVFEQEPLNPAGDMGTYTVTLTDMSTLQDRKIYETSGLGTFSFSPQYDFALVGRYLGENIYNSLIYCILDLKNNICTDLPITGTIYSAIEWINDYQFVGLQRPQRIDKVDIKNLTISPLFGLEAWQPNTLTRIPNTQKLLIAANSREDSELVFKPSDFLIYDLATSGVTEAAFSALNENYVQVDLVMFSPDGKYLYFSGNFGANALVEFPSGRSVTEFLGNPQGWLRDSSGFIATTTSDTGNFQILLLNAFSGQIDIVLTTNEYMNVIGL